jgi:hypothetical protein
MTVQRLHSGLAPIDVLTRIEHEEVMHHGLDRLLRNRYSGVESQRFPRTYTIAAATTVNIFPGSGEAILGPEEGDFWEVRRMVVKSNSFTDGAKYLLFRGSAPTDLANAYGPNNLLDGIQAAGFTTLAAPAVPASGVAVQNTSNQSYVVVISGGTATSTSVNGIVVGGGDGTFTVPAFGSISVTYSVAPTWTWAATQSANPLGLNVNIAFYPSSKSVTLQPGEQLYALVFGATVGNSYTVDGEAIRVPAEMKGKILS